MINLLHRQERPALFLHLHNCDAQTSLSPALFLSSDIHVQRRFQICVQPKNTKLRAPCISTTLRQHCLDANTSIAGKTPRPRVGSRIFRQNQNQPAPNAVTTCSRFPLSKTLPAPLMSRSQRGCAGCQHQSECISFPVDEAINACRGNGR